MAHSGPGSAYRDCRRPTVVGGRVGSSGVTDVGLGVGDCGDAIVTREGGHS